MNVLEAVKGFCPACSAQVPVEAISFLLDDNNGFHCPCGVRLTIHSLKLTPITPAKLKPEAVTSFIWHHATLVDDWHKKVVEADAHVHVGELLAAQELAVSELLVTGVSSIYFWEVRVKNDSVINPVLQEDGDADELFTSGSVNVYMNRFECPGAASLFLPARNLTPVSVKILSAKDMLSQPSFYTLL